MSNQTPKQNYLSILMFLIVMVMGYFKFCSSPKNPRDGKLYSEWSYQDFQNKADEELKDLQDCINRSIAKGGTITQYTFQGCGVNSEYIFFRDALDNYANLSSQQISQLKSYWQDKEGEMRNIWVRKMEESDRKARPYKY